MNRQTRDNKEDVLGFIFFLFVVFLILIMIRVSPIIKERIPKHEYYNQDFQNAEVISVLNENIEHDDKLTEVIRGRQELLVKVLGGAYEGQEFKVVNVIDASHNVYAKNGTKIVVGIRTDENKDVRLWVYNYKRTNTLTILVSMFFLLILIFSRWKGLYSITGLIFTAVIFIYVMLPLIFVGANIYITSSVCSAIALIISFLLIGGFNKKTLVAMGGTTCGLIVAGVISFIFNRFAHTSAINLDRGSELVYLALDYKIKIGGILYSSILIASLGAIMDVAMSISSSMNEIIKLNDNISFNELLRSGMNIGKDIIGTMTNTLILAFLGSSFGMILLLAGYNMQYIQISSLPIISLQIIQGLSGSIGIVLAVPFTALFACLCYTHNK